MYKKVRIDQCGYLPYMKKRVTFVSEQPVHFVVCNSTGKAVFEGVAEKRIESKSAGEVNYVGDFTEVSDPGVYYISADAAGESDHFRIGLDAYDGLLQKSMYYFYLSRCGMELKGAAGVFSHPACHTGLGTVYGSGEKKDVSGGWHDAGDYGRYVAPGAMAVAQLLLAYTNNRGLVRQYTNPDSAQKVMPEYLAECKYELDWMMKMQREDGALYHKATCYHFCDFVMPEEETEEMVLSPVSVTATADFAGVTAMAIPYFEEFDPLYAEELAKVSRKAYEALRQMKGMSGFKNPPEITTGEYGDAITEDELYFAAAAMYKAFGDPSYREDFEEIARRKIYHGYGWEDMGSYGNLAYVTCTYPVDQELKKQIKKSMIALADRKLEAAMADGYGNALLLDEYIWGSNLYTACNGLHLYDAYVLTDDKKYLHAAADQLHYLLGRNPMGVCYVTGCGTEPVMRPHHRPSGFLGIPMPGMLSGGPCIWMADDLCKNMFDKNTPPAKSFLDMTGSYSTNEITIYWNSALIQLLAAVY